MLDFDKALSQSPLSPKLAQSEGAADKPSAETAEHKRAADSKTLNLKSFDTFLTDIAAAPETLDTHSKETHGFAKGHTSQNVQTPIIDHDRIDHDLETFHAVELNLTAEPSLENSALASIDLPKAGAPTIDMPTLEHHRHADPVGVKTAPLEIDMPRLDHDRLPSAQSVTEIDMPRLNHDRLPAAATSTPTQTHITMPDLPHDRRPAPINIAAEIDMPTLEHDRAQPADTRLSHPIIDRPNLNPAGGTAETIGLTAPQADIDPLKTANIAAEAKTPLPAQLAQQTERYTQRFIHTAAQPQHHGPAFSAANGVQTLNPETSTAETAKDAALNTAQSQTAAFNPLASNPLILGLTPNGETPASSRDIAAHAPAQLEAVSAEIGHDIKTQLSRLDEKAFEFKTVTRDEKHMLSTAATALAQNSSSVTSGFGAPAAPTVAALAAPISYTAAAPSSPLLQFAGQSQLAANVNEVSQKLVRAVESQKGISVRLDPPEMGRVYIDFQFDGDRNVSAVIRADVPDMVSHLRDNAAVLQNLLKDSGFDGVALDFSDQASDSASFGQERENNEAANHNEAGSRAYDVGLSPEAAAPITPQYENWKQNESIDIRL